MQRWWFLDNKTKQEQTPSVVATPSIATVVSVEVLRNWTFRVFVRQPLSKFEAIAVTGECASLGEWNPQECVEMDKEEGGKSTLVCTNKTENIFKLILFSSRHKPMVCHCEHTR